MTEYLQALVFATLRGKKKKKEEKNQVRSQLKWLYV